jgi:Fe-S cluster assembly protein SufD
MTASRPLDFAPDASTLDEILDAIDARTTHGTVGTAHERRAAFAAYLEFGPERVKAGRNWRHDYARLDFDDVAWSSNELALPDSAAMPPLPGRRRARALELTEEFEDAGDAPALAVENAGGVVHLGSTVLQSASRIGDPRIVVSSLARARTIAGDDALASLGRIVRPTGDRFAALAAAFQNCGAYVEIPSGVALEAPVQLLWASAPGAPQAVFPRTLVRLGAGARATIVERHTARSEAFVCGTVEVELGAGARCDYVVVQDTGDGARLFFTRGATCAEGATIGWHVAELGGALSRTVLDAYLGEPEARGEVNAFFFGLGFSHFDLHARLDHDAERTSSDTVVRTAAKDRAQGRFSGTIHIAPHAAGADASMRDDALLLSRNAYIDAIPALEIETNDVSAAHAATVGSLDEEELFYVQSRGIARGRAERMIALAFFEPAIARFPSEALRDEVRTALDARLDDVADTFAQ